MVNRAEEAKKKFALERIINSVDPEERLRAYDRFTPVQQGQVRTAVSQLMGQPPPLDLPELDEDEAMYLEPSEQKNVRLLRAFERRGLSRPSSLLPVGASLEEHNLELEQVLQRNPGAKEGLGDAAKRFGASILTAIPKVMEAAEKGGVPVSSALETFRLTEAAGSTVIAALSTSGLMPGLAEFIGPKGVAAQEAQLKQLAAEFKENPLGLLAEPDENILVQAYEQADYPWQTRVLIGVVGDPLNLVPIKSAAGVSQRALMKAAKIDATAKMLWPKAQQSHSWK